MSFSSLQKGHWTPELLKTVQSKEMPNLSPVHSAAQSVFMNELYTTELDNSPNCLKGVFFSLLLYNSTHFNKLLF